MNKLVRVTSALIIRDRRVLFVRSKGNKLFYCPGGKIEANETTQDALKRELKEEISISAYIPTLYRIYVGPSPVNDDIVEMTCWLVDTNDILEPDNEIEELKWFQYSDYVLTTKIGDDILVDLLLKKLID